MSIFKNKKGEVMHELMVVCLWDKVAKKSRDYFLAETDEDAVRTGLSVFGSMYPLKDIELRVVGNAYEHEPMVKAVFSRTISWSIYKLPENKAENFKSVGIDVKDIEENAELNNKEVEKK